MHTTAILLAGGKGSRMDYRDKAWVEHQGLPLILHVVNRIKPQVDDIIISRNNENPLYSSLDYQCISDENDNYEGPLAGVMACLPYITTPAALIVPCDTPNLPLDLVSRLEAGFTKQNIAVAHDETRIQPLVFLAELTTLGSISDYLAAGERSVRGWIEQTSNTMVKFDVAFENINQPAQLR